MYIDIASSSCYSGSNIQPDALFLAAFSGFSRSAVLWLYGILEFFCRILVPSGGKILKGVF